ncbi:MAG TPA: ATP-binding protein [Candidatus Acidoferrales bacterium]|nr:ATP-binding protein [Candidatus Acidoferrales bacterium]
MTLTTTGKPEYSESFLASLVACSSDAIFAMDLDGMILSWNRAAEEMYGYMEEEILGKPVYVLEPAERTGEMKRNLQRLRDGEQIPHFETARVTRAGKRIDVSVTASLIKESDGRPLGVAVIARDISDQKRLREAVETANRIKGEFLENMSHELRTPMNGILGMTELVLDSELTIEQREDLGLVKVSTEALIAAVDEILDFSHIDTGKLRLEAIPFDFRESIGETMKMLGFRAQKKALELIYEVDEAIPDRVVGDPGRLRRILYSLVDNAIKFTEAGEVVVRIRVERRTASEIWLHFSVQDSGIGVSVAHQRTIFEPFRQADATNTRKFGGIGLGLSIASRLVELLKGRIWMESQLNKGSTFHFAVKLQVPEAAQPYSVPYSLDHLQGLQILVVDDNVVSRRVLRGMLNHWGMKATDIGGGEEALNALRIARDIGHAFPLVLLDRQMREMDGFLIAERIKQDASLAGATIMMLTSVGHVGDAARCRELGIASYLVKPIRLSELVGAICLALEKGQEAKNLPVTRHTVREERGLLAMCENKETQRQIS